MCERLHKTPSWRGAQGRGGEGREGRRDRVFPFRSVRGGGREMGSAALLLASPPCCACRSARPAGPARRCATAPCWRAAPGCGFASGLRPSGRPSSSGCCFPPLPSGPGSVAQTARFPLLQVRGCSGNPTSANSGSRVNNKVHGNANWQVDPDLLRLVRKIRGDELPDMTPPELRRATASGRIVHLRGPVFVVVCVVIFPDSGK